MSNLMYKPNNTLTIADSGSIGNYLPNSATITQRTIAKHPISVEVVNDTVIKSIEIGLLKSTYLPTPARKIHLSLELKKALLSIGLFYDNGCDVIFNNEHVIVIYRKTKYPNYLCSI